MVICVLAVASSETGALTIYKQFLDAIKRYDNENEWHVFIAEGMPVPTIKNVSYHKYHIKGLRRFWFDFIGFKRECAKKGIVSDVVFSLQNTNVKCQATRYVVYFHQALSLYQYKVKANDRFFKTYLFYHYFYPFYIRLLLNNKTFIAVQTNQIKYAFSRKFKFPPKRIGVFFPETDGIDSSCVELFEFEKGTFNFLFPATSFAFKEHITIVYALKEIYRLNPELAKKIKIHFTIEMGEMVGLDHYIRDNNMSRNFIYHGRVPRGVLFSMLKNCDGLLFPSVIETIGLPMIEAASLGIPIIANDLEYVHEVINGYEGVRCVTLHHYEEWGKHILSCCNRKRFIPYSLPENNSWERLIFLLTKGIIQS